MRLDKKLTFVSSEGSSRIWFILESNNPLSKATCIGTLCPACGSISPPVAICASRSLKFLEWNLKKQKSERQWRNKLRQFLLSPMFSYYNFFTLGLSIPQRVLFSWLQKVKVARPHHFQKGSRNLDRRVQLALLYLFREF